MERPGRPGGHVYYLDAVKIIGIFAVIVVHSVGGPLNQTTVGSPTWMWGDLFNSAARFCVPVFVMASGAMLLDPARSEPLGVFLRKRFGKVLLPFLFWVVFYYLFILHQQGDPFATGPFLREIVKGFKTPHLPAHLWFLPMIMGLYLATPVIRKFTDDASQAQLGYFLALCFVFGSVVPALERAIDVEVGIDSPLFTGYIGYFVLGRVLHTRPPGPGARALTGPALLYLAATAVTAYGAWVLNSGGRMSDTLFFGFVTPNVVAASVGMYRFIQGVAARVPAPDRGAARWLRSLGGAVFGIYLVHILVLRVLATVVSKLGLTVPVGMVPVRAVLVLAVSYGIIVTMQRVPWVRRLVP